MLGIHILVFQFMVDDTSPGSRPLELALWSGESSLWLCLQSGEKENGVLTGGGAKCITQILTSVYY